MSRSNKFFTMVEPAVAAVIVMLGSAKKNDCQSVLGNVIDPDPICRLWKSVEKECVLV